MKTLSMQEGQTVSTVVLSEWTVLRAVTGGCGPGRERGHPEASPQSAAAVLPGARCPQVTGAARQSCTKQKSPLPFGAGVPAGRPMTDKLQVSEAAEV